MRSSLLFPLPILLSLSTPRPEYLRIEKTSAGSKIVASGDNIFWVVMTIQKGTPPEVKVTGTGLDKVVRIGKQEITYQQDRIFWSIF
jgi:hypothetical protein